MLDFDVVVVGNGAVGSFAAMSLARDLPNLKVALLGPAARPNAASAAAGAMANVYAEVEKAWDGDESWTERQVRIGCDARASWRNFFKQTSGNSLITAEDTLVFLKSQASAFERANFDAMMRAVDADGAGHLIPGESAPLEFAVDVEAVAVLSGEFGFDALGTLDHLTTVAESLGVALIDDSAVAVDADGDGVSLNLTSGDVLRCGRLVVAAGAQTHTLLHEFGILAMLQGVGSAISMNAAEPLGSLGSHVVRTVNRGGAQCGLHTVPLRDGAVYLGAGNYIVAPGPADHRIETIRYLFDQFEREILGPSAGYSLTGKFRLGMRPRSLDGFPMLGPIADCPNIYVATATNRVGYCWAPAIADTVVDWARGLSPFERHHSLDGFRPDRTPLPFAEMDAALEYFVESRIGAALEHSLIGPNGDQDAERRRELELLGQQLMSDVGVLGSAEDGHLVALNPDNWTALVGMSRQVC